jgi:hypothetical protein
MCSSCLCTFLILFHQLCLRAVPFCLVVTVMTVCVCVYLQSTTTKRILPVPTGCP